MEEFDLATSFILPPAHAQKQSCLPPIVRIPRRGCLRLDPSICAKDNTDTQSRGENNELFTAHMLPQHKIGKPDTYRHNRQMAHSGHSTRTLAAFSTSRPRQTPLQVIEESLQRGSITLSELREEAIESWRRPPQMHSVGDYNSTTTTNPLLGLEGAMKFPLPTLRGPATTMKTEHSVHWDHRGPLTVGITYSRHFPPDESLTSAPSQVQRPLVNFRQNFSDSNFSAPWPHAQHSHPPQVQVSIASEGIALQYPKSHAQTTDSSDGTPKAAGTASYYHDNHLHHGNRYGRPRPRPCYPSHPYRLAPHALEASNVHQTNPIHPHTTLRGKKVVIVA